MYYIILNLDIVRLIMILCSLFGLLSYQVFGQPPQPSGYYGKITIDDDPAPVDTEVSAWINGINYPTNFITHTAGYYGIMSINGDDPSTVDMIEGGIYGNDVYFQVTTNSETYDANEIEIWESGVNHQLDLTVKTDPIGINNWISNLPSKHTLEQNFPNPFNSSTKIKYSIPNVSNIVIDIYSLLGQKIKTLIDESKQPGYYEIIWDSRDENGTMVTSGLYLYRLKSENFTQVKKLLLIR